MTRQPHVWVVEIWNSRLNRWEPCVLTRDDDWTFWQTNNTDDKFRLTKYQRVPPRKKAKR